MNNEELVNRRSKIFEFIEDNSLAILFSGEMVSNESGNEYEFEVNRDFFYLTNLDEEDCILLLTTLHGEEREILFIPRNDERSFKWTGIKLTIPEANAITEIDEIMYVDDFEEVFNELANDDCVENMYCLIDESFNDENYNLNLRMFKELYEVFDNLQFYDLKSGINELREVKSDYEVDCMRQAADNLKNAINLAMKITAPKVKESEVEATIDYVTKSRGDTLPFPSIVAGGKNATTLHYMKAINRLNDGDLVLLDVGSAVNKVSADVSRTYPVNGKFTDLQKKIYELVLLANKTVIENVKPGVTLTELDNLVIDIYEEKLKEMEIIESREQVRDYYYHFVSHYLGLNCHDPFNKDKKLVPGNVITVEPGLYFEEYGIGVRIEDDVLVTEDGRDVITKDIIKEVKDIENFMNK